MKKKLLLLLSAVLIMTMFSGCGRNKEAKEEKLGSELVIIMGRHANANMYTEEMLSNLEGFDEEIQKAFSLWYDKSKKKYCAQANISVIVSDGYPTTTPIVIDGNANKSETLYTISNTPEKREANIDNIISGVKSFLASEDLMADDENVDLLGALCEAQTIMDNSKAESKSIIIVDTGITTSGFLDMSEISIQGHSVDEIVNDIINEAAYPELKGIDVKFYGLGNVSTQQAFNRNDNNFKKKIVELWTKILKEKCHVGSQLSQIKIAEIPSNAIPMAYDENDESGSSYPYVREVGFEVQKSIADKIERLGAVDVPEPEPQDPDEGLTLSSTELGFEPNKATFRDTKKAEEIIKNYAVELIDYLSGAESNQIYVVGSIAKTSESSNSPTDDVSYNRAKKVIDILVKNCNIPADRIIGVDAGTIEFTWRDSKEFVGGTYNAANAQNNRLVRLVPISVDSEVEQVKSALEKGAVIIE